MARISEDARKCSVFLGYVSKSGDPTGIAAEGTGFLVYCGEGNYHGIYLVTCAHVARVLGEDPFVIRMNNDTGAAQLDYIDGANWYRHPTDETADIALMRYEPPDWSGAVVMPYGEFVSPRRLKDWKIGPGDAAYLVGLFYLHYGRHRNLPIVLSGNIAMMPDERILMAKDDDSDEFEEVEAYLVEMQALRGASGSPVMIRPTVRHMAKDLDDKEESLVISEGRDFLLGVWVAAWPGKAAKVLSDGMNLSKSVSVPVGMGLVVPAQKIIDILGRKDLIDERRKAMKETMHDRAAVPTRTAVSSEERAPTSEKNPQHKEDFTRLLSEAAKPKSKGGRT